MLRPRAPVLEQAAMPVREPVQAAEQPVTLVPAPRLAPQEPELVREQRAVLAQAAVRLLEVPQRAPVPRAPMMTMHLHLLLVLEPALVRAPEVDVADARIMTRATTISAA